MRENWRESSEGFQAPPQAQITTFRRQNGAQAAEAVGRFL